MTRGCGKRPSTNNEVQPLAGARGFLECAQGLRAMQKTPTPPGSGPDQRLAAAGLATSKDSIASPLHRLVRRCIGHSTDHLSLRLTV